MHKKARKEVIWSLLSKGVAFVLFTATNIFLARKLGVENFGQWSYFFSIVSILFLVAFAGLNWSSQRFIAVYVQKNKPVQRVLLISLCERVIISFLFIGAYILLRHKITHIFAQGLPENWFVLALVMIFFATIIDWAKKIFNGLHRLKYWFYMNFIEFSGKFLFVILFVSMSPSVFSTIKAFALALMITGSAGFFFLAKNFMGNDLHTQSTEKEIWKKLLTYSIPLFFMNFGFLFVAEIDTVMIGLLSSQDQVGYYAAAKMIICKLPQISMAISMGIMPVFAVITKDDITEKTKILNKALRSNAVLYGVLAICVLIGAQTLTSLLYGQAFQQTALLMKILIGYMLVFSFSKYLSAFLFYQGKAVSAVVNLFVCTGGNILLNYYLIPLYGAKGAAIATSVAYIPYVIINYILVKKHLSKIKR